MAASGYALSKLAKKALTTTAIIASLLAGHNLLATNMYWDSNGATVGAGVTPTGTWGTDPFWSTNSSGTIATSLYTTTTADVLKFSAGTDTMGPYTVTLSGTQSAGAVVAQTGNLTLSGGTLVLPWATGATLMTAGTANLIVSSTISTTNTPTADNLNLSAAAGTTITISGTVTCSSSINSVYMQSKGSSGTYVETGIININTNLGNDANLKAALQLGGIAGGLGTLNLNGAQTLGTTQVLYNDTARIGAINLGASVNLANAVQIGQINMYTSGGTGNLTGAVINVNSAVSNTGITLRSGGTLNVGGSLTDSGGAIIGVISDTIHGATMNILNGGAVSMGSINVVDGSVLTDAGTLNATVLTLGEATGNSSGKFVLGDATGTGVATLTQITTQGAGAANAIVGGNSSASTLTLNLSSNATFSGKLGGAGTNENNLAFVKQSASTLTLSGLNTYAGATTINAGTLKAGVAATGAAGAFGNDSAVTLANVASANLDITGFSNSIGSLAGGGATGGNVTLGSVMLTVGGNNQSTSFGGVISGASGSLAKIGTGSQALTGTNTYSGSTTISDGILVAQSNKALGNSTSLLVNGGTLDIRGATAGTVTLGTGANFFLTSGAINFQLGTSYDQLVSSGAGAFSITGGTFVLDVTGVGFSYASTYAIFSGFGGVNSVSGLGFTGYDTTNYVAALGSNGQLSFAAFPEPKSWTLFAVAGAFLLFIRACRARRLDLWSSGQKRKQQKLPCFKNPCGEDSEQG